MKTFFLVFNHELTPVQISDARTSLGVERMVPLPPDIQELLSNINPRGEFPQEAGRRLTDWLARESKLEDYVLVQGEFGLVWFVVNWCFAHGRVPVYATTERRFESEKLPDGSVKNIHRFAHVAFRRYPSNGWTG